MLPGIEIFPSGCRGAVSLTYDDASPEHLDAAIPDLESAGLRGTFFVPTRWDVPWCCWQQRTPEWRAVAARGHELGNHTQYHPCGIGPDWQKPNFALETYSLGRMEQELNHASRELDEGAGAVEVRSFAYPCCQEWVGIDKTSYRPTAARLFPACRVCGELALIDPLDCDFSRLPSSIARDTTRAEELITLVEQAIDQQKWAVLTFHGIDADNWLSITRQTHRAVLRHIADRRNVLWCDTFLTVALQIRQATKRPWIR